MGRVRLSSAATAWDKLKAPRSGESSVSTFRSAGPGVGTALPVVGQNIY